MVQLCDGQKLASASTFARVTFAPQTAKVRNSRDECFGAGDQIYMITRSRQYRPFVCLRNFSLQSHGRVRISTSSPSHSPTSSRVPRWLGDLPQQRPVAHLALLVRHRIVQ